MPWIQLLKPVDAHKAGDFLDVDEPTSRAYVDARLAEARPEGPEKHLLGVATAEYLAAMRDFARRQIDNLTEMTAEVRVRGAGRPNVVGADRLSGDPTASQGDFIRQVYVAQMGRGDAADAAFKRLEEVYGSAYSGGQKRDLAEGAGTTGGFSTPVLYESQWYQLAAESAIVRPRARQIALGARQVELPALDQYQVPAAGQSAMFGGVTVWRKGETQPRTASQPRLSNVVLMATDLVAFVPISRDLMQDSTAVLDSIVPRLMGDALAWREDWECFQGSGADQILGVYNAPGTIGVSRQASGNTFSYIDSVNMQQQLMPSSAASAIWVVHPFKMSQIRTMQDPSGRYLFVPYSGEGAGAKFSGMLGGLPVLTTDKAPAPGNPGDVGLFDFSQFYLGTRAGLEIGMSTEFLFGTDEVAIRAKLRNDGKPANKKAITLADGAGSNKVSPFVQLI